MTREISPGRPTTRRYSEAEKERAVRAVMQLRKELGTEQGTIGLLSVALFDDVGVIGSDDGVVMRPPPAMC